MAVEVSDTVQIVTIVAGVVSPVLMAIVGVWVAKMARKQDATTAKVDAVIVKVDEVATAQVAVSEKVVAVADAQVAVADKVETAVVTAGVAVNKAVAIQREVKAGTDSRTQMLEAVVAAQVAVVAKVDTMQATVDSTAKTATETHVLVDGQMGVVLEIGLEAAQGRYDDNPTDENKSKLEAARKKFEDHEAKMKIVQAKNAATPEAKP